MWRNGRDFLVLNGIGLRVVAVGYFVIAAGSNGGAAVEYSAGWSVEPVAWRGGLRKVGDVWIVDLGVLDWEFHPECTLFCGSHCAFRGEGTGGIFSLGTWERTKQFCGLLVSIGCGWIGELSRGPRVTGGPGGVMEP